MSQNQFKTQQPPLNWLSALWRFSRPHTIFGTTFSVVSLFLIALAATETPVAVAQLLRLLAALVACLAGNLYIVGLNQLEDIAIDQINKPHLPVASGEFSRGTGVGLVATTGSLALLLALAQGPWLLATVGISLGIGTAYSLPPIRLKRFPFWAALCIFTVRGVIVNLGLFLHFNQQMGGAGVIPPSVWALTLFILGFTFAIAIFKDMPDLEGDRRYNITTLTLQLGTLAVFNLGRWVLTLCYGGMAIAALLGLPMVNQTLVIITHLAALGALWWRSSRVNLHYKSEIASFYQFVWKLFFLEYFIFTAACLF
jgi:homogentisate phytyltransferase / homogentisate geranylgeranyltransferase